MANGKPITTTTTPTPSSLSLPFRTKIQLTFLSFITDTVRRHNGTINRRLMNFLDRTIPPTPTPRGGVSTHDITVNTTTNFFFRLFIPHSTASPTTVIVFFHGGGFVFLSAASYVYDAVCRRLSRHLNVIVCSVNYRLSPEHKFPSQYDDGFSVLSFLDNHCSNLPSWPPTADLSTCFLAGDSAGGNIAHHLAVKASQAKFKTLKIVGLINIQPFFGGEEQLESEVRLEGAPVVSAERTEWMWRAFLPEGMDKDHWAVNVSGPNAVNLGDLDLPPTVIFIGGFDPLKDWQRRYYEWLKVYGKEVKLVEYPNAIHAFYVFPELSESSLLIDEVKRFIDVQRSKVK